MSAKTRRFRVLLGSLVLAALVAVGFIVARSTRVTPRNVVLILIDTLRADHLGAYGYHRRTSPFLDDLAARSVLFENAVSAASVTFPSVNSLFTSRLPNVFSNMALQNKAVQDLGIPEEMTTLAEVFIVNGFRTGAVSASPVVRNSPSSVNSRGGFGQGFEQFDESCGSPQEAPAYSAPCVTKAALHMLSWLEGSRFFLYVHYLDPHDPYRPPHWSRFGRPYRGGKPFVVQGITPPISGWLYEGGDDPQVTPADIHHLVDLYDGEVRGVDAAVRQLFEGFARRGRLDDTLFVLVADHGESFMEHNHIQHGRSVYETELHVPLIFHWKANWKDGERRDELVCTIDIMPTILDLVGLPVPKEASGVPLFSGGPRGRADHRVCFSEGRIRWDVPYGNPVSVRTGTYKIIYDRSHDAYEAFDLANDPNELKNLVADGRATADPRFVTLRPTFASWFLPPPKARGGCEAPVPIAPEVKRALKALGYVH